MLGRLGKAHRPCNFFYNCKEDEWVDLIYHFKKAFCEMSYVGDGHITNSL